MAGWGSWEAELVQGNHCAKPGSSESHRVHWTDTECSHKHLVLQGIPAASAACMQCSKGRFFKPIASIIEIIWRLWAIFLWPRIGILSIEEGGLKNLPPHCFYCKCKHLVKGYFIKGIRGGQAIKARVSFIKLWFYAQQKWMPWNFLIMNVRVLLFLFPSLIWSLFLLNYLFFIFSPTRNKKVSSLYFSV